MIVMRGNLVTLEPMDIEKHAKGYFEVSQDENIHLKTAQDHFVTQFLNRNGNIDVSFEPI